MSWRSVENGLKALTIARGIWKPANGYYQASVVSLTSRFCNSIEPCVSIIIDYNQSLFG